MRPFHCVLPAAACALALLAAAPASGDTAAANPTLVGENLTGTTSDLSFECNGDQTTTASFTLSGAAIGPYPGTFTESATATITNHDLTSFEAAFTIMSAETTVTGTKEGSLEGIARCEEIENAVADTFLFYLDAFLFQYRATIISPLGTSSDSGRGEASFALINSPSPGTVQGAGGELFIESTQLLPDTEGLVTGGGRVEPDVRFGFIGKSRDAASFYGTCDVVDALADAHVKCVDVTGLAVVGTHATVSGDATVNDVPTRYRMDVDDLGEPGIGRDTFKIQTDSGYFAGGVLTGGDIQIHS
jgi:hypothetical protein